MDEFFWWVLGGSAVLSTLMFFMFAFDAYVISKLPEENKLRKFWRPTL
jgi:hypothetical protein